MNVQRFRQLQDQSGFYSKDKKTTALAAAYVMMNRKGKTHIRNQVKF